MCETLEQTRNGIGSGRRKFLRVAGIATALGLTGGTFLSSPLRKPHHAARAYVAV